MLNCWKHASCWIIIRVSHLSLSTVYHFLIFNSYSSSQIIEMAFAYRVSHRSCRIRQTVEKKPHGTLGISLRRSLEGRGDIRKCWLLGISARKNVRCPCDARKHNLRVWYANRYHRGNVNIHILSWQRPARDCRSVVRSSTRDVSRTCPSSDSRRATTCSPANHACASPRARSKRPCGNG